MAFPLTLTQRLPHLMNAFAIWDWIQTELRIRSAIEIVVDIDAQLFHSFAVRSVQ